MRAAELYLRIEEDFKLSGCIDEWDVGDSGYITENFKTRSMGLMTDNADIIERAYTAVFSSEGVIRSILSGGQQNSLLFVHHPMDWDITRPEPFLRIPESLLQSMKGLKVSIYNLHTALDKNGEYSTTVNLAKAAGIEIADDFYEYSGGHVGVIGKTQCKTVHELKQNLECVFGHDAVLYGYGEEVIAGNRVALIAGGGNIEEVYGMLSARGINTYITGITSARSGFEPSVRAHEKAKENGINMLGGTHYSTEKFACMKMAEYFNKLGLPCEFIPDRPCMEDM